MKAMVLSENKKIEDNPLVFSDVEPPRPNRGEILVRVKACAFNRTDLHIIEGDMPSRLSPLIPGHQIVGEVVRCGIMSKRFSEGDRVGIGWLHSTHGSGPFNKKENENLSDTSSYTGYSVNGGFAQFCVVPEDFAFKIPKSINDVEAAPLLGAGIMGYRAIKLSQVKPGKKLGIYGFGAAAHVTIQIARYWNCNVYVVTRSPRHQQMALEMGAFWAGTSNQPFPQKVDSAIIFAPNGDLVIPALNNLERGGTLVLASAYMSDLPPLNYQNHLFQEKNLRTLTSHTREDGIQLLDIADLIPIRTKTVTFPLKDANQALQTLKKDGILGAGVFEVPEGKLEE